ncbi:MAG: tRNA uridine-5-carboxymethylaminomethyl(34) synthesis GTPase MnmE, partial [Lachnospiraceae bacterium]|nr:tRNA uridine-5-carboxymethylaminomethyl(34) synthesis GTPase MnmE [Lachnospiraceae bacterium]
MSEFDTIAAICSGLSSSGVCVIRVSGDEAVAFADKIVSFKDDKSVGDLVSHSFRLGKIVDFNSGSVIDQGLVLFMKGPRSYTGEDVVELQLHGGIYVASKVLRSLIDAGCKMAEPGEFTKRAFLNGKMDLTQAEAVM